ncbi:crotonase/enoyl-CoA hydratase family protein [Sphingobium naphthae]|uniref:Crotonase/enoyl-CoA hydratase family protein n=1 Tax=Sphingobium naphthae TaxID=1886786 RepID=A0ABU4A118_9SPHN|nr:crotonase/enoyl-CoA hydratase family protein [Sphingobium naphthae]MCC4250825.1 crotonase/enoyl-CoA hydratase family protein [Sphingobium naphthae]MDV5825466.1 crotonase/enoyl-CoA hydratase family protein [Sphingobium naphthae]|tara:strand:+ start:215 stop:1018 length:804 start_codon:yes stop_codon:yes gene_type:complete
MSGPFLIIERENAIATVTLNRPSERNAISRPEYIEEIRNFCADATRDPSLKAVIVTGAGSAFCAGGNVKDMRDKAGIFEGSPYTLRNRYRDGIQQIPLALYELEVPTIAAINGPAIGAGLDLACMCDVRIASQGALFAESFVKLGIVPGDGGAWLLPRIVGNARAALMTLTGDAIDTTTALDYGLISQVVPPENLLATARAVAQRIAANPGHALRLTKRLLREGQDMKLGPLLELSAAYQALAHHTADHEEAVNAFLEKRSPRFGNR